MDLTKLLICALLCVKQATLQSLNVEIILDRVEHVGSTEFFDATELKVKRSGRDRKLYGKFVNKIEIDNSLIARLSLSMKTGAGWNILPYKVEKPYCKFIEEDTYFYPELANHSNLAYPGKCPLPAGTIDIDGWEPSFKSVPDVLKKNGEYKIILNYVKGQDIFLTFNIYTNVINIFF